MTSMLTHEGKIRYAGYDPNEFRWVRSAHPRAAVWPEAKAERLRMLWAAGVSLREMMADLHSTKGAVLGQAFRMELKRRQGRG